MQKGLGGLGDEEQPYDVPGRLSSSSGISSAGAPFGGASSGGASSGGASSGGASSTHASPWDASEGNSGGVSSAILAQLGIASLIAFSLGQLGAESGSLLVVSGGGLLGSSLRAAALFAFFPIIALGRIPCILFGYRLLNRGCIANKNKNNGNS